MEILGNTYTNQTEMEQKIKKDKIKMMQEILVKVKQMG